MWQWAMQFLMLSAAYLNSVFFISSFCNRTTLFNGIQFSNFFSVSRSNPKSDDLDLVLSSYLFFLIFILKIMLRSFKNDLFYINTNKNIPFCCYKEVKIFINIEPSLFFETIYIWLNSPILLPHISLSKICTTNL